jgi:tellurite resistance protein
MTATDSERNRAATPARHGLRLRRIPPNTFGIAFGLSGLAEAWHTAEPLLGTPAGIADALYIVAAAAWLVVTVMYTAHGPRPILADLRDPVAAPFVALAVIVPMLLGTALAPASLTAGRVVVVIFLAATAVLGGWLTGQWIVGDLALDSLHPGYFLPTVAGGLVGATAAAEVGLHTLAVASFGLGLVSWLVIGSLLFNRLFFRPMLPPPLVPTLAIEFAPPTVGGAAYFALSSGTVTTFAAALGGYAILMAVVQLRLIPLYARLRFSPGFWSFTFSYAAGATDALLWLTADKPAGARAYACVVVALITLLIVAIAARTAVAVARGQYLPAPPRPLYRTCPAINR